jgi:hypothetical protein
MVSIITILLASGLVLLLVWAVSRPGSLQIRSLDDWESKKREVDLDAFRLLLDPKEEQYLRSALRPPEFREFQRRRLALALRSLDMVGKNASMLMKLGQLAKEGADPELARKAEELVRGALKLRVNLLLVQPYLALKWMFPGWRIPVPTFALPYEELLGYLNRLRQQRQWAISRVLITG